MLQPDQERQVQENQAQLKFAHDAQAHLQEFAIGQSVMASYLRPGNPQIPTIVVTKFGPVTYMVRS